MNNRMRQLGLLALLPLALTSAAHAAPVTISPAPGTVEALPGVQISFLGAPAGQLRHITVVGSSTGKHGGKLRAYLSAPGASFLPARPFRPGEDVTVHATLLAPGGHTSLLSTSFTVAQPAKVSSAGVPSTAGSPDEEQSFVSAPNLHPPVVTIEKVATTAPGRLFAAPFLGPAQYGPMIFDNDGHLVWFRALPAGLEAADFRVQHYAGRPVLTWWQGHMLDLGYGVGTDVIAGAHYQTLALVKAGNGLRADDRDFKLTPQGQALITAYSPIAPPAGQSSGPALDRVVQEIDPKTGLVMREWHSLGSVPVADPRSVQLLPGGDRLLSGAGLPSFTELNRSGEAVLEGQLPKGDTSLGVYSYRWSGHPAQAPALAATTQSAAGLSECTASAGVVCPALAVTTAETTVYMSWNGATGVASWQVSAGPSATSLQPVARVKRSGFETNVTLPGSDTYVQAQALDASGKVLASSAVVKSKGVNE